MFKKPKPSRVRPGANVSRSAPPRMQYYSAATRTNTPNTAARDTPDQKKRRRPYLGQGSVPVHTVFSRLPYYFSAALIVVSLGYCSILGNTVSVLIPADTGLNSADYYQTQLSHVFNSSFFNHSKLTFDAHAYRTNILQQYPELADVTVRTPLVSRMPVIGLAFKTPALIMHADGHDFVISDEGLVLADASSSDSSKIESLLLVQEDVPLKLNIGKPALTRESVSFITEVASELKSSGKSIDSLTLPLGANELHVRLKDTPYVIKFAASMGSGAKQQVGALLAVQNTLKDQPQPAEYIDVRLAERVFVK